MATTGDLVYGYCLSEEGRVPFCGWVLATLDGDLIIGTCILEGIDNLYKAKIGTSDVGILRVAASSVTLQAPVAWSGTKPGALPTLSACEAAWRKVNEADVASSETEPLAAPKVRSTGSKTKRGLASDLQGLTGLFGQGVVDEDDSEDDDEDMPPTGRKGHLPPGSSSLAKTGRKIKDQDDEEIDLRKLVVQGLAAGQSPTDVMPLMLAMLLEQQGEKKKKKSKRTLQRDDLGLLGGSDSDSSSDLEDGRGVGMKAVSTLNRLHRQIRERPLRICELFEKEVIEDLGVVKGQAWTLKDYVRKQQWGKFKGMYRCAMMDVAAYEFLRSNQPEVAAAQLVQNLKAKMQSVLQGGEWTTAWLLTGLSDPLSRREFAGSKEEMAIISGYTEALHKLQKRVRESRGHSSQGAAEDEDGSPAESGGKK